MTIFGNHSIQSSKMTDKGESLCIDVDSVLRSRLPKYYKFLPKVLIRWLERTICQDEMNDILSRNSDYEGVEFCRRALADLGVNYTVTGCLPSDSRRVIFVSNHPLGGLDGLILADMVSAFYGDQLDVKFVVNDLLNFVTPLNPIFVGVNKYGEQSRDASVRLENAFASDGQIIMFPAGLVSRKSDDGSIADLRWHKMVIQKAINYQRDIIPLYFNGVNSQFFYKFARLRTRLGLKFNIEMIFLPREIFKRDSYDFNIKVGTPISWTSLRGGTHAQAEVDRLRETVYNLV